MSILGIFDSGGSAPTGAGRLLPALLEQLRAYPGGIAGLLSSLRQGGLEDIVASWVGTGPNRAVSSEQLQRALDPGMLQGLTRESGEDVEGVLNHLTTLLPLVIDKMTPDGTLRDEELDPGELKGMLTNVLGRFL